MSAYPFDTTSTLASNLIKNETHFAGESEYYGKWFIVPEFGPFYLNNFKITATTNGVVRELTIGVDYAFTFFYKAGSQSIGIPLFGGITLNKSSVNKNDIINITYQTLGGDWVADRIYVINQLLATSYNPILTVLDLLTDKLSPFPDIKSPYVINPEYGAQGLVVAIRNLAVAISKQETLADIIAHLSDFNNPHMDTKAMIGLPDMQNYPIALDSEVGALIPGEKYIVLSQLISAMMGVNITLTAAVNVYGPKLVYTGTTANYVISDFDSRQTYTYSVDQGSITLVNDTLTFTPPTGVDTTVTMVINGSNFPIAVKQDLINQPVIEIPTNNETVYRDTKLIVSSAYQTVSGKTAGHTASDWQLATDATFTDIAAHSENDTTDLTTWTVLGLVANTPYFVRVRYHNADGVSEWSNPISFTYSIPLFNKYETNPQIIYPQDIGALDVNYGCSFGNTVSMTDDGRLLAISAPVKPKTIGDTTYTVGEVYIYRRNGSIYEFIQSFMADTPNAFFGGGLGLSGDGTTLVVIDSSQVNESDNSQSCNIKIFKNSDLGNTDQFVLMKNQVFDVAYNQVFVSKTGNRFIANSSFGFYTSTSTGQKTVGLFSVFDLDATNNITLVSTYDAYSTGLESDTNQQGSFCLFFSVSNDFSTIFATRDKYDVATGDSRCYIHCFKLENNAYVNKGQTDVYIDPDFKGTLGQYYDNLGVIMNTNENGSMLVASTYYFQYTGDPGYKYPYLVVLHVDDNGQFTYLQSIGKIDPYYPNVGQINIIQAASFNRAGNTLIMVHSEVLDNTQFNSDTRFIVYEADKIAQDFKDKAMGPGNYPVYTEVSQTLLGNVLNPQQIAQPTILFDEADTIAIVPDSSISYGGIFACGGVIVLA